MNMTTKTMSVYDKLAKELNVELTDDYRVNGIDLEIGTLNTADGYELHTITSDPRNLEWEYDVYYYEPDFNTVIERIKDVSYDDDVAVVFVADFDQYLPEYEVQDYLEQLETERNGN
jgi:hypothetical protein